MNAWKYNTESTRMITKLLIKKLGIEYSEIYKEVKSFNLSSGTVVLKNGDEIIVELIYKQKGGSNER